MNVRTADYRPTIGYFNAIRCANILTRTENLAATATRTAHLALLVLFTVLCLSSSRICYIKYRMKLMPEHSFDWLVQNEQRVYVSYVEVQDFGLVVCAALVWYFKRKECLTLTFWILYMKIDLWKGFQLNTCSIKCYSAVSLQLVLVNWQLTTAL